MFPTSPGRSNWPSAGPALERTSSTSAPAATIRSWTCWQPSPHQDPRPGSITGPPTQRMFRPPSPTSKAPKKSSAGPRASPSRTALSNEFLRTSISRSEKHRQLYTFGRFTLHALHLRTPRFSVRERSPRKPQPPIPHRFADQTAQTFAPKIADLDAKKSVKLKWLLSYDLEGGDQTQELERARE